MGVVAMIAGEGDGGPGPLLLAAAHAGFEPCEVANSDAAARHVAAHGARACVLVLDAGCLEREAAGAGWSALLARHPSLPAVLVARGPAHAATRALAAAPHRVLLEDPFDAAAVVGAARRACAGGPPGPARAASRLREAG